jgi:hypothetical protein
MFRNAFAATVIAAALLAMIAKSPYAQPRRVQVGTLACSLSSGIGLGVGSQRNVNCDFTASGAPVEHYTGTMTRIGLDIGVTTGGAIIWAVFADTDRYAAAWPPTAPVPWGMVRKSTTRRRSCFRSRHRSRSPS